MKLFKFTFDVDSEDGVTKEAVDVFVMAGNAAIAAQLFYQKHEVDDFEVELFAEEEYALCEVSA